MTESMRAKLKAGITDALCKAVKKHEGDPESSIVVLRELKADYALDAVLSILAEPDMEMMALGAIAGDWSDSVNMAKASAEEAEGVWKAMLSALRE